MTVLFVQKFKQLLIPLDQFSERAMESLINGAIYKIVITKPRNIKRHRKFFVLLNFAYDQFEQKEIEYEPGKFIVGKCFEQFREDITIMAGYGYPVFSFLSPGEFTYRARSIKFSKMDDIEFNKLYSAVFDVILQKVLINYEPDELEETVLRLMELS